jgi:hypothetical protein
MADTHCPECDSTKINWHTPEIIECGECSYRGVEHPPMLCPACNTANNSDVDACYNCGEPMSLFWQVLSRHSNPSQSLRLEQVRSQANKIKSEAFAASQERYSQFEDIDRRRLQAEREDQLARESQDRQLLITVGIALGIFAVILVVVAIGLGAG